MSAISAWTGASIARNTATLLDKPRGYVCATEGSRLPTVLELLPEEFRGLGLFPVGGGSTGTRPACCCSRTTETMPTRSYRRSKVEKSAILRTDRSPVTVEDAAAFARRSDPC